MLDDIFNDDRLFLFAGHYGSGKTEVAVNFALGLAARSHRAAIVDFDIINPYFRTTDARAKLTGEGVRVISSRYANTNVDVPALPAEINTLFEDRTVKAVFDVGGDDAGAKAVSRYRDGFLAERAAAFFVFNLRRPMTADLESLIAIFYDIERAARVPFTAIVNNTNMLSATTEADLLDGLDAALALSTRLSLPVAFSSYLGVDRDSDAALKAPPRAYKRFYARSKAAGIPVFRLNKHIMMDYI